MKNVLITGSSSGFGKEMVETLAKNGFNVIASMRNTSARKNLFSHLPDQIQKNIKIVELDVTIKSDIEMVFKYIEGECPNGLDALINNAGYGAYGSLEETSEKQLRAQMEVNFFGLSLLIQELLPLLRKSKGKIINITSYMGQFSIPLGSIYSASKFAVEGLSEGLYFELAPLGVQVCSILPGGHKTGFISAIEWGSGRSSIAVYENHKSAIGRIINKVEKGRLTPGPENISSALLKLLSEKNMPRKYYLGADARLGNLFQALTPDFIYYPLMKFIYKQIIKRGT